MDLIYQAKNVSDHLLYVVVGTVVLPQRKTPTVFGPLVRCARGTYDVYGTMRPSASRKTG
jgi:hypothetical protein